MVGGVAAATVLAGPVIALAGSASAAPQASKSFTVRNDSGFTMQLVSVTGGGHFEGAPTAPHTLGPGDNDDYELQLNIAGEADTANYQIIKDNQGIAIVTVQMSINSVGGDKQASCTVQNYSKTDTFSCPPPDTGTDPVYIRIFKNTTTQTAPNSATGNSATPAKQQPVSAQSSTPANGSTGAQRGAITQQPSVTLGKVLQSRG
jgi:hypothetical protein